MPNTEPSLNVQEGIASQVFPPLSQQQEAVLVFISKDGNAGANKKRFSVLRQVAERIDTLIDQRGEEKWNALVEALTPDVELSHNRVVEAEMLADARRLILENGDFVKASAIAGAADFSSKIPAPSRTAGSGAARSSRSTTRELTSIRRTPLIIQTECVRFQTWPTS